MRIDKNKLQIACARNCISSGEIVNLLGITRSTLSSCVRKGGSPKTIGKIAKAIGVDVTEIIDTQEVQP